MPRKLTEFEQKDLIKILTYCHVESPDGISMQIVNKLPEGQELTTNELWITRMPEKMEGSYPVLLTCDKKGYAKQVTKDEILQTLGLMDSDGILDLTRLLKVKHEISGSIAKHDYNCTFYLTVANDEIEKFIDFIIHGKATLVANDELIEELIKMIADESFFLNGGYHCIHRHTRSGSFDPARYTLITTWNTIKLIEVDDEKVLRALHILDKNNQFNFRFIKALAYQFEKKVENEKASHLFTFIKNNTLQLCQ